jgi:hypothetical protein
MIVDRVNFVQAVLRLHVTWRAAIMLHCELSYRFILSLKIVAALWLVLLWGDAVHLTLFLVCGALCAGAEAERPVPCGRTGPTNVTSITKGLQGNGWRTAMQRFRPINRSND